MACAAIALLPGHLPAQAAKAAAPASSGASGTGVVPDWVGRMVTSDMLGLGEGGKRDPNYKANGTGFSRAGFKYDPSKPPHQMALTKEEQDIMDGKKGKALAKVMKTVVAHGNAFGADKLVDLGARTHSSFFNGPPYIQALLDVFNECADEGLKAFKPFTVNPRPFDLYNVETQPDEMAMVFEGYSLQTELDYLLIRLGAEGMNTRSCACYLPEIGNKPEPGTMVAWAESSAVNYGNSVLGIHWGVLGGAIGVKCSEDVPYIAGIDKYLGGKITDENMHHLKAMGSATASNGAVGLYHVENITPDAIKKGRKLLVKGYKTYVIDDAELKNIYKNYPNLWSKKDAKPNRCYIGCPHNTYHEILTWGKNVTEALKKRGQAKVAMPTHLFCATVVRDHLIDEHPELVRDMKRGGMSFSNMCALMFTGLKGYQEKEFAVTNSNKTRKYSSSRYFPDDVLLEIILTGKMPKGA
jgi:predicted aconitase